MTLQELAALRIKANNDKGPWPPDGYTEEQAAQDLADEIADALNYIPLIGEGRTVRRWGKNKIFASLQDAAAMLEREYPEAVEAAVEKAWQKIKGVRDADGNSFVFCADCGGGGQCEIPNKSTVCKLFVICRTCGGTGGSGVMKTEKGK